MYVLKERGRGRERKREGHTHTYTHGGMGRGREGGGTIIVFNYSIGSAKGSHTSCNQQTQLLCFFSQEVEEFYK